ncbi:MAG: aspartate kinase [Planctomycetaceae bacterium]|nr:aspartate kinase [Planctomycetaceae bacterium]
MSVIVQKFGGTSVANAEKIRGAAQRAVDAKRKGHKVVCVVSARGHKTDELVDLAAEITSRPRPREMDMLLSTGEQESVALMAMAVHELGEDAVSLTGAQIGVLTDTTHTKARIVSISTQRMNDLLDSGAIVIAAGFQGVDANMNITTLGRGGSDTTATALAAVLKADQCEIYTDVEGVFTTDPRLVSSARKIERISYDEMLELASLGAGVMHSRSIEFAKKYSVLLRVRPAYSDGPGTLIAPEPDEASSVVTGVAFVRNEALVALIGLPDEPGVMSHLFSALSAAKIPVDMVVQNVAREGTANVSFTVPEDDLEGVLKVARAAVEKLGARGVQHTTGMSKVSVVGHGMQRHSGVAAKMFQVLSRQGINVSMVTTSEIKISVLIERDRCNDAVTAVHSGFELEKPEASLPEVGVAAAPSDSANGHEAALVEDIAWQLSGMEDIVVSDVYADKNQSRITISCLPDVPGVAEAVFTTVAQGGIMVDMIVQNVAREGQATISFTVPSDQCEQSLRVLKPVLNQFEGSVVASDASIGKISVVGIGLRSHTDVGARLFRTLGDNGVNVEMINTSEIKISVVVKESAADNALRLLRAEFHLA